MSPIHVTIANPFKLPTVFFAEVEFPFQIRHKNKYFNRTGKYGTDVATSVIPAAQYKSHDDEYIWMDANEVITSD